MKSKAAGLVILVQVLVTGSKISPEGVSLGLEGSVLYSPPMANTSPFLVTPEANHWRAKPMSKGPVQVPVS